MATTKISITVDTERLEELRSLANKGVSLSAIIDEALNLELHRIRMLELLDEMEDEYPISDEDRNAGNELWQRIKSCLTPEPSRALPKTGASSVSRSRKR